MATYVCQSCVWFSSITTVSPKQIIGNFYTQDQGPKKVEVKFNFEIKKKHFCFRDLQLDMHKIQILHEIKFPLRIPFEFYTQDYEQ